MCSQQAHLNGGMRVKVLLCQSYRTDAFSRAIVALFEAANIPHQVFANRSWLCQADQRWATSPTFAVCMPLTWVCHNLVMHLV